MFIPDKTVKLELIDSPIYGMEMIANNEVLYVNFTVTYRPILITICLSYMLNLSLCFSRSVFYDNPRFLGHVPRPPEKVAWPSKVQN